MNIQSMHRMPGNHVQTILDFVQNLVFNHLNCVLFYNVKVLYNPLMKLKKSSPCKPLLKLRSKLLVLLKCTNGPFDVQK